MAFDLLYTVTVDRISPSLLKRHNLSKQCTRVGTVRVSICKSVVPPELATSVPQNLHFEILKVKFTFKISKRKFCGTEVASSGGTFKISKCKFCGTEVASSGGTTDLHIF
jgi:hypothetical protein